MKLALALAVAALATGSSAFSETLECTPDSFDARSKFVTSAMERKYPDDPATRRIFMKKINELAVRYMGKPGDPTEGCTAYDALMRSLQDRGARHPR